MKTQKNERTYAAVHLPLDMHAAIKARARQDGRTLYSLIREVLEAGMKVKRIPFERQEPAL